jgi:3-phosphoshikimate 1-carboxyvinyltransferase
MDHVTDTVVTLMPHTGVVNGVVTPPSSKSESNRVLIINALAGGKGNLSNLSNARDTQTMIRLLEQFEYSTVLDVLDAGTTMRFLTAYTSISGQAKTLTGTQRMKERPIKLLVDALRELGAHIDYKEKEGYPPILIHPFQKAQVNKAKLTIKGDVSSQYITALLMIAPGLPQGLTLELTGKVGSKPYIAMTLSLMKQFGIQQAEWKENIIHIPHQSYTPAPYTVESDWSAASYWYSIAALSKECKIEIKGYKEQSLQGDRVVADIMDQLGVKSTFTGNSVILEKKAAVSEFKWDFTDCPDLAQTIAVICAAKGIEATMSGLESLRIKETDRITAIQDELKKFGAEVVEIEKDITYKVLKPANFKVDGQTVATYKDHRMAMAFAPLALLGNITIENPEVVDKSYPHYWTDLKSVGFEF